MVSEQLLSVLSCQRFLTLNEVCKEINLDSQIGQNQLGVLEKQQIVERRFFAGRNYFRLTRSVETISNLGTKAWGRLSRRKSAVAIGQARTCYHHLAGKVGVRLFQLLIQTNLVRKLTPTKYILTEVGKQRLSHFLAEPIHQTQIQTCIDFSERLPHLAGSLGTKMLSKLVKTNVVTLAPNRRVRVNVPLERWFEDHLGSDGRETPSLPGAF
jgi:predicted transcriptional regulator